MLLLTHLVVALSALTTAVHGLTGDSQCNGEGDRAMCVDAVVQDNSTTRYTLTVKQQVGWMAMGFGRSMTQADLVVLYRDSTGETIISQRTASDYVEPKVVESPSRVATVLPYLSAVTSDSTSFSYEIPSTTDTRQSIIWAWCSTAPQGTGVGATLTEHDQTGQIRLNLANPIASPTGGTNSTNENGNSDNSNNNDEGDDEEEDIVLTYNQKLIVAHGVLLSLAFVVILPIGALLARLSRTFLPGKVWFGGHWMLQWPTATVLIIIGFALGVAEVQRVGKKHFSTRHKSAGMAIIVLYIVQLLLGGFIHFIKSAKSQYRPPQNYAHAVFGLTIIALSFWQVRTGYAVEWPRMGAGDAPKSVSTWWTVWAVLIPVLYFAGLGLLPRQYRMEAKARSDRVSPLRQSFSR